MLQFSKALCILLLSGMFFMPAFAQKAKKAAPSKPVAKKATIAPAQKTKATSTKSNDPFANSLKIITSGNPAKPLLLGFNSKIQYKLYNYKDSLLDNSYAKNGAVAFTLNPSRYPGSLEDNLSKLHEGDSATFTVNTDSMFKMAPPSQRPPFIPKGTGLRYIVKIEKVIDPKIAAAEAEKYIDDYAKTSGKSFVKYPSGLRIAISELGTGQKAMAGDTMTMHYKGTLLNGTKFDASYDRNAPFTFVLGTRQVIQGWDEGIAQLTVGTKAILLIPANLAYGERSPSPAIPANSPLLFEIEVLKAASPKTK